MFVTPVSWAMICCVRRAIRAASSVGSASASSKEFVCSDCVPPSTPASASIAVRTMLFSGCWAVSDDARRLRVEAHPPGARVLRAEALAQLARPDAPRGAVLGDLLEEVDLGVEEEAQPRREVVDVEAALDGLLDVGQAVLDRERELLGGGRAGLADVVARHADRMPARHRLRAPLDHVAAQAHRRVDREAPLLLGDVLLEDVGLDRAAQPVGGDPPRLRGRDVEGEHHDGRRVDRHRDGDLAEVDAVEQRRHVVERVDGDALAADLAVAVARRRSRSP